MPKKDFKRLLNNSITLIKALERTDLEVGQLMLLSMLSINLNTMKDIYKHNIYE